MLETSNTAASSAIDRPGYPSVDERRLALLNLAESHLENAKTEVAASEEFQRLAATEDPPPVCFTCKSQPADGVLLQCAGCNNREAGSR